MAKPFDVTMKHLVTTYPADWLRYLNLPVAPVHVIDADLATVSASADKVLHVQTTPPFLTHLEFQAHYDGGLDGRTLRYNVLLDGHYHLPVVSVIILLRRAADGPAMSGRLQRVGPDGEIILDFRYRVVRLWEQPVATALEGPLGTLPLAPLTDVKPEALPTVIARMEERIEREAAPGAVAELWAETFILMGLRYSPAHSRELLKGVRRMKESLTYQEILLEGRAEGRAEGEAKGRAEGEVKGRAEAVREALLSLGTQRFGPPEARFKATIAAVPSVEELQRLLDRLLKAESWNDLILP